MSSPRLMPWIVQLIAAAFAACGGFVAFELVHATFITPRALGGSFWSGALQAAAGVLAAVLAFVLTPTQVDHGRAFAVTGLVVRIVAVAGFWVIVLLALFRLARRLLT